MVAHNIARIKAALHLQGVAAGYPRLPVLEPEPTVMADIARVVALYGTFASPGQG